MKKLVISLFVFIISVPAILALTNVLEQENTISIIVNNDKSGMIKNAFTTVFLSEEFIINSNNPEPPPSAKVPFRTIS